MSPDIKNGGVKEKEAAAIKEIKERFDRTIRDSFGGDSKVVRALLKAANNKIEDVADPDTSVILLSIDNPDKKIGLYFAPQWERTLVMLLEKKRPAGSNPKNYTISRIREITCESEKNGTFTVCTGGGKHDSSGRVLTLDINEGTVSETNF